MTFSYLGYLWALLGCALLVTVVGITGTVLYVIGRRAERGTFRAIVQSVPPRRTSVRPAPPPGEAR